MSEYMITCETCNGEGVLYRQVDVDHFVYDRRCDTCHGNEEVQAKCDGCDTPLTDENIGYFEYLDKWGTKKWVRVPAERECKTSEVRRYCKDCE